MKAIGEKSEIEPDKVCVLSEKNKVRYDAEQKLRNLMFVERDCMLWQHEPPKSIEERKEAVKQKMQEGILADLLAAYLENIDFLDQIRGDVVKKTTEMYD